MQRFNEGDRVRIDIPEETDPDHTHHGVHGQVQTTLTDDAAHLTDDDRDAYLYRVLLTTGETIDVRWRDLRPPLDAPE